MERKAVHLSPFPFPGEHSSVDSWERSGKGGKQTGIAAGCFFSPPSSPLEIKNSSCKWKEEMEKEEEESEGR